MNYLEHKTQVKFVDGLLAQSQEWQWLIDEIQERFEIKEITSWEQYIAESVSIRNVFGYFVKILNVCDKDWMTEAQQYELGSYVNLMLSSTQLLVNPIIGLKPKYGEDEFEKFILWKGRKAEKELCDDFKPMIISFANFLYKIDIDDKDKKLLYKTFKSNKKMLRALNVKKKEFKIEIFDAVEEALSHSYR